VIGGGARASMNQGVNKVVMSMSHNGGADQMVSELFEGKTTLKAGEK
jgi:hypothetical protein